MSSSSLFLLFGFKVVAIGLWGMIFLDDEMHEQWPEDAEHKPISWFENALFNELIPKIPGWRQACFGYEKNEIFLSDGTPTEKWLFNEFSDSASDVWIGEVILEGILEGILVLNELMLFVPREVIQFQVVCVSDCCNVWILACFLHLALCKYQGTNLSVFIWIILWPKWI